VSAFPDKGTDEQKAAWRAENNVPAAADKYEIKLADGKALAETDKPLVEAFTKDAHERNLPAGAVNDAVNWFVTARAERAEAAKVEFDQKKKDTAAALGAE
jgi:hypothetical protein